jgi:hypothetical protein
MIEEGMLLYFAPPYLAGGLINTGKNKRIMLVVEKCEDDNTLTLVNISKVYDKPNCFTYPYNVLIRNFNPPLPLLSFAKVNNNYIVENFAELSGYIYKGGTKLNQGEFDNIIERQKNHKDQCKIETISFTRSEFLLAN